MNLAEVILETKSLFYKLRKDIRCFCAQYPEFYFSQREKLYGFVDNKRMINSDTEIVIDGYPCSANTFAVKAFKMAQARTVNIAHHTHDPSQLIAAAKANIPAIVLVRNPEEAVVSYTARFHDISNNQEKEVAELINDLLSKYIDFYRRIIKYRKLYVVAEFKTLTLSYDLIIKQVNNKYGTNFNLFFCNDKSVEQVFARINQHNEQRLGYMNENNVARPSRNREKTKEELYRYFESPMLNSLLATSHELYYEITL